MLHVHHESEEKFHFPKLEAALPAAEKLPESFLHGHTEMVTKLNQVLAYRLGLSCLPRLSC